MAKQNFLLFGFLLLGSCVNEAGSDKPMEYKLATLNMGSVSIDPNHPTVKRFKSILDRLNLTCSESRDKIGDMIYLAFATLEDKGARVTLLRVASDLDLTIPDGISDKSLKCAEVFTAYILLRSQSN